MSIGIRGVTRVNKNKVVCWANSYKLYGCNPKYITEYLLEHSPNYTIYWVLNKDASVEEIDDRIKIIRPHTLKYLLTINTAGFVFNNFRTDFYTASWKKRKSQRYIMTWHGSQPLKMIERDFVIGSMKHYYKVAEEDSKKCNLMLSSSKISTEIIRRAMVYEGEVLEKGIPRNDIFFDDEKIKKATQKVKRILNLTSETNIVLYAPTFRTDHSIDHYDIDWVFIEDALNKYFRGGDYKILYRLHPDLASDINYSLPGVKNIIDVSGFSDMQELMCCADILITDYSSTMFEYALLKRPCFLFASDFETYDRNFYFNLVELPFPLSKSNKELSNNIMSFDNVKYNRDVENFMTNTLSFYDRGHASEALLEWMDKQ